MKSFHILCRRSRRAKNKNNNTLHKKKNLCASLFHCSLSSSPSLVNRDMNIHIKCNACSAESQSTHYQLFQCNILKEFLCYGIILIVCILLFVIYSFVYMFISNAQRRLTLLWSLVSIFFFIEFFDFSYMSS